MLLQRLAQSMVVAAAFVGASAPGQLVDPSFENVCTWAPFEAWTPIGGNQFQTNSFARSGVRAAFMYGNFFPGATPGNPTGINDVGFQQTVSLPPGSDGQTITGAAWIMNQTSDPLGNNVNGFVVIDFFAEAVAVGTPLTSATFGNNTNPYDMYVQLTATGAIPAGATSARMSVILQQSLDFSDNPAGVYRGGAARYDDATLAIGAGANLLVNAGFENICAKPFFDWESFGGTDHVSMVEARTGTHSNKAYGPFFFPGNTGGFFQDLPATAGSMWTGSIYYLSRADDQINTLIDARLRVEFYDAANVLTAPVDSFQSADIAQGPATPTTWTQVSTPVATAPANTTKVRLVVIHSVPNFQGGAIYYDDASLAPAGAPNGACCAGSTCSVSSAAACTGTHTSFAGPSTVCNLPGNQTTPCCKADYNHAGGVTVQDIFDFLAGYFSGDTKADFNGGGISVQDIFDYLAAYFTGCA